MIHPRHAILIIAAAASSSLAAEQAAGSTSYDYLLFVQQWPPTECMSGSCKNSSIDFFTVHGMWPSNIDGSYPSYCTEQSFDPSKVQSIEYEMAKYWPSFRGSDDSFWAHEYEKHGTCAEDVWSTELDFFSGVLERRSRMNILNALQYASIYPDNSKSYDFSDIQDAVKSAFGHRAAFSCNNNNLDSVSLCIDRNFATFDCPSSQQDECSDKVWLPASGNSASRAGASLRGAGN